MIMSRSSCRAAAAMLALAVLLPAVTCPAIPSSSSHQSADGGGHQLQDNEVRVEGAAAEGPKDKIDQELDDLGLEYGRYLQQVVSALEADKDFSAKLENASVQDIKSGVIADQLHFVDHSVRSKLDELKRIEIERLHRLTMKEKALKERLEHGHVDTRNNPHSFEVEDLHRLILAATKDLEAIDAKRKLDFKEYEMQKELQFRAQLASAANETERVHLLQARDQALKRHADHPRVHHPGSRAQLEQVWAEQDHLPKNDFDPKTFFSLHDLNGDGYLDVQEVEALLSLEVRKLYDPKHNPEAEDDPREMMEEFHRMREHIYREADKDRDGLISRHEFLLLTTGPDFESKDKEGWQDIGSDPSSAHKGGWDEHELARYYERMHKQQQMMMAGQQQQQQHHQQQVPQHLQQQQQQAYYYDHLPPPADYYGYQHDAAAGMQQQPQPQPQFVPQQHMQQQQYHPQQQQQGQQYQQHNPQQQQQHHEQTVNFHGQVYGMPVAAPVQQHRDTQQPHFQPQLQQPQAQHAQAAAMAAPSVAHAAAAAPTAAPVSGQQQQQPQQHNNGPTLQH